MIKVWLQEMLRVKQLRHVDVSTQAGITRAYFTQIISGKRRPSPDVAKKIATVLGFPGEWYRLLEDDEEQHAV